MSIIISILVFGFIVFIHELGHFVFAKRSGILVEEFAIGMGPVLFSKKRGDTKYSIRLLPLGGFCAMLGEDKDDFDPRSFNSKSVKSRIMVIVAGALFNAILALVIFCTLNLFTYFSTLEVTQVVENSYAENVGILPGDKIKEVNGNKIIDFNEILLLTEFSKDGQMDLTVERNGEKLQFSDTMTINPVTNKYNIGIRTKAMVGTFAKDVEGVEKASFLRSIKEGFVDTYFVGESTFLGLKLMLNKSIGADQVAGPIGIVSGIDESYKTSMEAGGSKLAFLSILSFMALISANLAIFNLLPIPALDGGRLVFLIYELITKKKVPPEKEGMVHFTGFVVLMVLAVLVSFNDVKNLF